jgi:hypothetical protein
MPAVNRGNQDGGQGMMQPRRHLGVDFAIWEREDAWFWFLINPRDSGGLIGTATNEAAVELEACVSIEEILTVP